MKTVFCAALAVVFLSSCADKIVPIKGTYQSTPFTATTTKSFDDVWDKLIDLFAQHGLPIKLVDRSSGLIISSESRMPATIELKNGALQNKDAFVVVPQRHDIGANRDEPVSGYTLGKKGTLLTSDVSGEWNVRIKKSGEGCIINVNLVNLSYDVTIDKYPRKTSLNDYKSTGVFENIIANYLK